MLTISIILFLLFTIFSFMLFKYIFKIIITVLFFFIFFHIFKPSKKILKPFYSNEISKNKTTTNWLDTLK